MRHQLFSACLAAILTPPVGAADETAEQGLDRAREEALQSGPDGAVITVWVGESNGAAKYTHQPDREMPVASAIKVAILVELYARYEAELDERPRRALRILRRDDHPALRHYSKANRQTSVDGLIDLSVDEIGRTMIGTRDAPNAVYNAAANLSIALLGSPKKATELMHKRDPAMAGLALNRYMLADRTERGDNTATAEALAVPLCRLARRDFPGLKPETVNRLRDALLVEGSNPPLFRKGGSLTTHPLTSVRSGWRENGGEPIVCVVMGAAPADGASREERQARHKRLSTAVTAVWTAVRDAYRVDSTSLGG